MRTYLLIAAAVLVSTAFSPAFGQDVPNNPQPTTVPSAAPATKSTTPVVVKVVEEGPKDKDDAEPVEKKASPLSVGTKSDPKKKQPEATGTPIEEAPPPATLIEQAIEEQPEDPSDGVAATETMVEDDSGLGAGVWITIIGGGIAVAGAASWFTWRASALSDAEAAQGGSDQAAFDTSVDDLDTAEAVSMGLMVGGGVIAVAGSLIWAFSGDKNPKSNDPKSEAPSAMITPTPGGLSFAGTFW